MGEDAWLRPGDASRFVDALGELPMELWRSAAVKARENEFARAFAANALESLLQESSIAVERWSLRDDVETAAWYGLATTQRAAVVLLPRDLEDAVHAAYVAAAAVLLRLRLGDRRFRILYEPFADFVPRSRLSG